MPQTDSRTDDVNINDPCSEWQYSALCITGLSRRHGGVSDRFEIRSICNTGGLSCNEESQSFIHAVTRLPPTLAAKRKPVLPMGK